MLNSIRQILNKERNLNLLLFFSSFGIYFIYFHYIFFNLNSILSSITLDTLKNYYTYVYHIKNDGDLLNFSGMNFPFGEHVVYTDCQPILTFILKSLPFTHNYLIGILHSLLFFSFIITPLILNKILRLLDIDKFSSFFVSLAITLLSPQFLKINGGHHALAYACVIPFSILLILNYLKQKTKTNLIKLFTYNTLLFLLHPYLGFSASLFCFVALIIFEITHFNKTVILKNIFKTILAGLLPLLLFKVFMSLTDHHQNRTSEPYGAKMMLENPDSVLSPVFGPFQNFLEQLFPNKTLHFEGHTYLGFFTIILSIIFILSLPFTFKKLKDNKEILAIFVSSIMMLLFSFGLHIYLLDLLKTKSPMLNQFRAVCRFAWFFYYALPLFVFPMLYHWLKTYIRNPKFRYFFFSVPLLFFSFNMLEGHYFLKLYESVFWKFRNFFNEKYLNPEEQNVLKQIAISKPQAIIPLPIFHGGSEIYDRPGSNNSMIPSMIYSYHSGIPIFSVMMSRTSITETEEFIELLDAYKKQRPVTSLLNDHNFLVLKTNDHLMPDEERLLQKTLFFQENDSLKIGYIAKKDLLSRRIDKNIFKLDAMQIKEIDSNQVVFIPFQNSKPFLISNMMDYERIYTLDSNKLKSGEYIVSLHHYYAKKTYQSVACELIVTKAKGKDFVWDQIIPIRFLSGFYPGFGIFEYAINLEKECMYEFIIKGTEDQTYKISNFLLRPTNKTTIAITHLNDTIFNNFPQY